MLAVGLTTDAGESMAFNNALKTFTLRSTDNIHILGILGENVGYREGVAQFKLSREVHRELYELALGSGSCLFEVPFESSAGVFLFLFVIGKLYSGITIFFDCTHLRDNTWTSLNNGAWNIFSISTENGNHSDFLSN